MQAQNLVEDLKANLIAERDDAQWEWLQPHAQREAVVLVSKQLDLVEVGIAIATDNAPQVQQWIGDRQLQKPSPTQISQWDAEPTKLFSALIVQPFVLVQEKSASVENPPNV